MTTSDYPPCSSTVLIKPRINQKQWKGCPMKANYSYNIAGESMASSPWSNVPIHCPICLEADPVIWSTSWRSISKKNTNMATYEVPTPLELWKVQNEDLAKTREGDGKTRQKGDDTPTVYIGETSSTNTYWVSFFFFPFRLKNSVWHASLSNDTKCIWRIKWRAGRARRRRGRIWWVRRWIFGCWSNFAQIAPFYIRRTGKRQRFNLLR